MSGTPYGSESPRSADAPAPPQTLPFDVRDRAIETVVIVASVVALRALGLLLLLASSPGRSSDPLATLVPFLAMVFDLNLLAWVAIAGAVQFGLRSMRRPGRWALIVLAVPVAVLLVNLLRNLPGLVQAGPLAALANGVAWLDAGILTVVVALGLAIAAGFVGRDHSTPARIASVLLALGGLLTLVLAWQAFATYFTLGSTPDEPTQAEGDRYLVTAGLTAAAFIGAIVCAAVSRRRGLIIASSVVGCVGLVLAFVLQVPSGRFIPDPEPAPAPGGGSSCYGEGDPNCIGG